MNLNDNPRGGTFCLAKAGLKIGNSDEKDIDIAATNGTGVDYVIDGVLYNKANTADIPVVVTNEDESAVDTQAADTTCLYLFQLDTSGDISTIKGKEVLTAKIGQLPVRYPTKTDGKCAIGYVKIVTDGVTFLCGTDDFSKSDVADTYVDLFALPPDTES